MIKIYFVTVAINGILHSHKFKGTKNNIFTMVKKYNIFNLEVQVQVYKETLLKWSLM
jgi:hypothetical protein